MLLFYIRHGDPIYAPDQLTGLGRRQAEAVGRRLALYGVDRIFSSTSTRAYQTALPTAEILKKEITQLDFAHELDVDLLQPVVPKDVQLRIFFLQLPQLLQGDHRVGTLG